MDNRFKAEDEWDVVIAVTSDVIDLYLVWKIALLSAVSESREELKDSLRAFLLQYYGEEADRIIEEMFSQGTWIVLPNAVPFVKEYYDAVLSAYELY